MPSTHNRRGVTIVTRLHPPHIDAAGQYAEQLAEGLASRGWSRRGGLVWKILTSANAWSVRRLQAVVTPTATMVKTVSCATGQPNVSVIELWADPRQMQGSRAYRDSRRAELGLTGKFIAMYAGNLGIGHCAETLCEAIEASSSSGHLRWVLVGSGIGRVHLARVANRSSFLHLVSLCPGFDAVMFPSKFLAAIASGTPMVAICDADSELGRIVMTERIGIVVAPGDARALVESLELLRHSPPIA